jgi:hypothetical protein
VAAEDTPDGLDAKLGKLVLYESKEGWVRPYYAD